MLRSIGSEIHSDVSGQVIGTNFEWHTFQQECLDWWRHFI